MLLSAWADKAPFDNGIKAFITKGDRLKWIGERTDPRGKGFQMHVISPIHVRPFHIMHLCSLSQRGCGG